MDKNIQESRRETFKKIKQENWDIIIVGGGITGAGILREAAHLNIKALLVEQRDFAWGTSSRSTKMEMTRTLSIPSTSSRPINKESNAIESAMADDLSYFYDLKRCLLCQHSWTESRYGL